MARRTLFALALLSASLLSSEPQRVWAQESEKKQATEKAQMEPPIRRPAGEPRITKTFFLPGFWQALEMQDATNALRTMTDTGFRVYQISSASTIMVSGTPDQIKLAESIVDELEKSKSRSAGNYRVEFRIGELENGKRLGSKSYSLVVGSGAPAKLRSAARLASQGNAEAGGGNKPLHLADLGPDIDCAIRSANDKTGVLSIGLELLTVLGSEGSQPPADSNVRQFKSTSQVELEWGKPMFVTSFDDPISKRTLQVEVIATRLTTKP